MGAHPPLLGAPEARGKQASRNANAAWGAAVEAPLTSAGTVLAPRALFEKLCGQFRVDGRVAAYLVDECGLETLEDFLHVFTSDDQIEARSTDKVPDLQHRFRNAARLRRAWAGVKEAAATAEDSKKRGREDPDLDALLPAADLRDLRATLSCGDQD